MRLQHVLVVIQELAHVQLGVKVNLTIIACFDGRVDALGETLEVLRLKGVDEGIHGGCGDVRLHQFGCFEGFL